MKRLAKTTTKHQPFRPDRVCIQSIGLYLFIFVSIFLGTQLATASDSSSTIKSQSFYETETAYFYTRATANGDSHFYLPKLDIKLSLITDRDGKQLWRATANFKSLSDREKAQVKEQIEGWGGQPVYRDEIYAVDNCEFTKDQEGQIKAKLKFETVGMTFGNQSELCSFAVMIKKSRENIRALKRAAKDVELIKFGLQTKIIEISKTPIDIDVTSIYEDLRTAHLEEHQAISKNKSMFLIGVGVGSQLSSEQITDIISSQDPIITVIHNHIFDSDDSKLVLKTEDQFDDETVVRLDRRDLHEINL